MPHADTEPTRPGRRTKLSLALLLTVGAFCVVGALTTLIGRRGTKPNVTIQFLSLTNGAVGPVVQAYMKFSPKYYDLVNAWMKDKTNAAVVRIINHEPSGIWIFPFANIKSPPEPNQEALVIDAPTYSGVRIPPGEAREVQVAVFRPQTNHWKVSIGYTRERVSETSLQRFARIPLEITRVLRLQPIVEQTIPATTDWLNPVAKP